MSWFIVFWLVGGDGRIFAHDSVHGFATEADCRVFGGAIPVKHGMVRWECRREDNLRPVTWYTQSKY